MSETGPDYRLHDSSAVIDNIQPALAALCWHNFLKRLDLGMSRVEARAILKRELQGELEGQELIDGAVKLYEPSRLPLLDTDVARSVAELRQYLAGTLNPKRSYLRASPGEVIAVDSADNREEYQRLDAECTRVFYQLQHLIADKIRLGTAESKLLDFQNELRLIGEELQKAENQNREAPNYYQELNKVYRAALRRLLEIKDRIEDIVG